MPNTTGFEPGMHVTYAVRYGTGPMTVTVIRTGWITKVWPEDSPAMARIRVEDPREGETQYVIRKLRDVGAALESEDLDDSSYVQLTDGSVLSLVCYEGRHQLCPDETEGDDDHRREGFGPLSDSGYYCECTGCEHGPAALRPADPESDAQKLARLEQQVAELTRTRDLLLEYGTAKFGDEWWPGNARNWIGAQGRELEYLLDPGSAELADQQGTAAELRSVVPGMPHLPAHGLSWEVAFGPVDTVIEAHSAEQAATMSVAERDYEDERDRHDVGVDPNPAVWVRQMKAKGTHGPWQQVYLDPAAIEAEVARLRAEYES
jgi:hypothetical protein